MYPHLKVQDIRGNLNTRLAKLDAEDSKFAGIILATAGLQRMGWHDRISETIDAGEMLYAVGQGALAVECLSNNRELLKMLRQLVCHQTQCRILVERSFLKTLGGGCSAPVAVDSLLLKNNIVNNDKHKILDSFELKVIGSVWSLDGKTEIRGKTYCTLNLDKNDDEGDLPSPNKKIKLSSDDEHNSGDNLSNENKIGESQVDNSSRENIKSVDIADIINVETFKKCPYSSIIGKTKPIQSDQTQNSTNDNRPSCCPLNFKIGQDVMGECPYFTTAEQKIENDTAKISTFSECPFRNNFENKGSSKIDIEDCPIMKASTSHSTSSKQIENSKTITSETIFCGLFPHHCWPIEVFEKCEKLGKDLATQLIENGALAVMECAQNEIRQKS